MNTQELLIIIIVSSGLTHIISYKLVDGGTRNNFVIGMFLSSLFVLVLSLVVFVAYWIGVWH